VKCTSPGSGRQRPAARGESNTDETRFFGPLVENRHEATALVSVDARMSYTGDSTTWVAGCSRDDVLRGISFDLIHSGRPPQARASRLVN